MKQHSSGYNDLRSIQRDIVKHINGEGKCVLGLIKEVKLQLIMTMIGSYIHRPTINHIYCRPS